MVWFNVTESRVYRNVPIQHYGNLFLPLCLPEVVVVFVVGYIFIFILRIQ